MIAFSAPSLVVTLIAPRLFVKPITPSATVSPPAFVTLNLSVESKRIAYLLALFRKKTEALISAPLVCAFALNASTTSCAISFDE